MPTLIDFTAAERQRIEDLESDARDALAKAQSDLSDARQAYDDALADRVEAEAAVAAIRKSLGQAEVAPAADSGGDDLRDALVTLRAAQTTALSAKLTLAAAEDDQSAAAAEAEQLREALLQAQRDEHDADERGTTLAGWSAAVAAAPYDTLASDASNLLTASAFTDAEAKVAASLPSKLLARSRDRRIALGDADAARRDHLRALEDLLDGVARDSGGVSGALAPLERALERAEIDLAEFVRSGPDRYQRAQNLLAKIAARATIDPDIRSALDSDTDRDAAADAEAAVDLAAKDVTEKQLEIDLQIATLLAADPDADVDADATVQSLRGELSPLEASLSSAEASFDAAMQTTMAAWRADVPSSVWTDLDELERARDLLDALAAANPSTLLSTLDSAEDALVSGLEDELTAERSAELTASTMAETGRAHARALDTRNERLRAALEGLL